MRGTAAIPAAPGSDSTPGTTLLRVDAQAQHRVRSEARGRRRRTFYGSETASAAGASEGSVGAGSPQQRLKEQDTDGIDGELLFASEARNTKIKDKDAFLAIIRAFNDYFIEEYCAVDPDRLIGVAVMPDIGAEEPTLISRTTPLPNVIGRSTTELEAIIDARYSSPERGAAAVVARPALPVPPTPGTR